MNESIWLQSNKPSCKSFSSKHFVHFSASQSGLAVILGQPSTSILYFRPCCRNEPLQLLFYFICSSFSFWSEMFKIFNKFWIDFHRKKSALLKFCFILVLRLFPHSRISSQNSEASSLDYRVVLFRHLGFMSSVGQLIRLLHDCCPGWNWLAARHHQGPVDTRQDVGRIFAEMAPWRSSEVV